MSAHCCNDGCASTPAVDPTYRRVLVVALVVNAVMFAVELAASLASGSVALLGDSADFAADAFNYGISLAVLGTAAATRAKAAAFKALCMAAIGAGVLLKAAWTLRAGATPEPLTMGVVGFAALAANVGVALLLYRYRSGDANMRSVWICSRNDALGNLAVVAAAAGVFGTGRAWPDLVVAVVMGGLALSGAATILRQARAELRTAPAAG
jgi:Co/Zn/Cd efflux system component